MNVRFSYSRTVNFLWGKARLIALLRRTISPWTHTVVTAVGSPCACELSIYEAGHTGVARTWTQFISGNQMFYGSI